MVVNDHLFPYLLFIPEDGKEGSAAISSACSAEVNLETNEFSGLSDAGKDEKHAEYQSDKSPQLQLSAEHYFLQTTDGKLIQVWTDFIMSFIYVNLCKVHGCKEQEFVIILSTAHQ